MRQLVYEFDPENMEHPDVCRVGKVMADQLYRPLAMMSDDRRSDNVLHQPEQCPSTLENVDRVQRLRHAEELFRFREMSIGLLETYVWGRKKEEKGLKIWIIVGA